MKIVVLAGGLSQERDVSLCSGSLIANALRQAGHHVVLVDVYEGILDNGIKLSKKTLNAMFSDKTAHPYEYIVPEIEPNLEEIKQRNNNGNALIGPYVIHMCQLANKVFIALHGSVGENAQIQAMFDVLGIPYTGTGYIGSLLAMDKDISKRLMCQASIPTPEWRMITEDIVVDEGIIQTIKLPCVVKPCSSGSSIGISMVNTVNALRGAILDAKKIEANLLIEKRIEGREFSVGILKGEALPVIEIIPKSGFYDYRNKYQANLTDEICPADLSKHETTDIQNLALNVHSTLRLGTYSRIDFIQDEGGVFYCLEANTLPGMTPTSLIPQEALAKGISYIELCDTIVKGA